MRASGGRRRAGAGIVVLVLAAAGCEASLPAPLPVGREAPPSARGLKPGAIPLRAGVFVPAASRNAIVEWEDGWGDRYALETGVALELSLLRAAKRTFAEARLLRPLEREAPPEAAALLAAEPDLDLVLEARFEQARLDARGGTGLFLRGPRAAAALSVRLRAVRREGGALVDRAFAGEGSREGHATFFGGGGRVKATEAVEAAFQEALDAGWTVLLESGLPRASAGAAVPAPDLRDLAGKRNASVVKIVTETTPPRIFWARVREGDIVGSAVFAALSPLVVLFAGWNIDYATGTGILLDADGRVLTNRHVLEDASGARVTFLGGREVRARRAGVSKRSDLGLLALDAPAPPAARPAPLGDPDALVEGEAVCAIGHPFLLQNTLSVGVVSAAARTLDQPEGEAREIADYIQFDAPVNPGNSGGPLVNGKGEVVGIVTAKMGEGLGFAIPASAVRRFLDDLAEGTAFEAAGLDVRRLDWRLKRRFRLAPDDGLVVVRVKGGSPWDRAGARIGDLVEAADGAPPASLEALREDLARGRVRRLSLSRGGKAAEAALAQTPPPAAK